MTDLTPNDLSHLSDAEFNALCPQGEHAPGPEPLSPADVPHPMQPLVKDSKGVVRFKENQIVQHLLDTHSTCDLNDLACMNFTKEDRQQFAQLLGYSLAEYGELSYAFIAKAELDNELENANV